MAMAISVPLYTVDDLERFPDDGNRYELLDGVLLVTPQAAAVHQVVASRIQVKLANSLQGLAHVSRSSRVYDREFKCDAYFALGLHQVWLVDWRDEAVEVWTTKEQSLVTRDTIRWRVADADVVIDLRDVFAGLARQ